MPMGVCVTVPSFGKAMPMGVCVTVPSFAPGYSQCLSLYTVKLEQNSTLLIKSRAERSEIVPLSIERFASRL